MSSACTFCRTLAPIYSIPSLISFTSLSFGGLPDAAFGDEVCASLCYFLFMILVAELFVFKNVIVDWSFSIILEKLPSCTSIYW